MAKKSRKSRGDVGKRLLELEVREKEIDSRLEILELKERELGLEIDGLRFVVKKRQELSERKAVPAKSRVTARRPKAKSRSRVKRKRGVKDSIDEGRKSVLTRQIKSVLDKRRGAEDEEKMRRRLLDSKKLIEKERISVAVGDESDAMHLFKLVVDGKSVKLGAAAKTLGRSKKEVNALAKELEKNGLISISSPFYGEPTLNLKLVPTQDIPAMRSRGKEGY